MAKSSSRGRPRKHAPKAGDRVSLGLRVTAELKESLDVAAARSGRSQSQEAEFRLERSFRDQRLLPDSLELAYGSQLAGLLLILGDALKPTAMVTEFALPQSIQWTKNQTAYDQMIAAAETILAAFRPAADEVVELSENQKKIIDCGVAHANTVLDQLDQPKRNFPPDIERRRAIEREFLGDLMDRLKSDEARADRNRHSTEGER